MNKRKTLYSLAVIIPLFALMVIIAPLASVSAHGFGSGSANLSQEQKDVLEKAKALAKEGKKDEAKKLLEDAGLKPMHGLKRGMKEPTAEMKAHHEAVMAAIKANDFAKFKELTADKPFAGDIDADAFAKLVKADELRAAGDEEGAKALLKDVIKHDIGKHSKDKKDFKHKMKRGADKPWRADRNAPTTSE